MTNHWIELRSLELVKQGTGSEYLCRGTLDDPFFGQVLRFHSGHPQIRLLLLYSLHRQPDAPLASALFYVQDLYTHPLASLHDSFDTRHIPFG